MSVEDKLNNLSAEYLALSQLDNQLLTEYYQLYIANATLDPVRVATGVDIFRYPEYAISLDYLHPTEKDKILDIGSRDTFWAAMLLQRYKCTVYATDIDTEQLKVQKYFLANIAKEELLGSKFFIERQDATKLNYPDNYFDKVTAISALEHIPGDGDITAMQEIHRVLKPGGSVILTAPFGTKFLEYTAEYYGGYEKRYNQESIEKRFFNIKGLALQDITYLGGKCEQIDNFANHWYNNSLYTLLGAVSMFISLNLFELTKQPDSMSRGFIAKLKKRHD
ncbi:MAG: SAM-dependent methyltransferase [Carboxydocellales bacterium]